MEVARTRLARYDEIIHPDIITGQKSDDFMEGPRPARRLSLREGVSSVTGRALSRDLLTPFLRLATNLACGVPASAAAAYSSAYLPGFALSELSPGTRPHTYQGSQFKV